MAKYEVIIKNNETGKEEKYDADGLSLMMQQDGRKASVQHRDVNLVMLMAALEKDEYWNKAAVIMNAMKKAMREIDKDLLSEMLDGEAAVKDSEE